MIVMDKVHTRLGEVEVIDSKHSPLRIGETCTLSTFLEVELCDNYIVLGGKVIGRKEVELLRDFLNENFSKKEG